MDCDTYEQVQQLESRVREIERKFEDRDSLYIVHENGYVEVNGEESVFSLEQILMMGLKEIEKDV